MRSFGHKPTILIVEDDPATRTFYQSALMLAGYRVVGAEDGIEALRRIEGERPAAVVLDLALPRMSGRDVSRELLAHPHFGHVPIVIVTGSAADDVDPRTYCSLLRKPIHPDQLVAAVDQCLSA